jgi:hypothetical protein
MLNRARLRAGRLLSALAWLSRYLQLPLMKRVHASRIKRNKDLITNIQEAEYPITMNTNVGSRKIEKNGDIPGMKYKVWYDDKSMANIFSFADLVDQYHVVYDSHVEDAFVVDVDGKEVKFPRSEEGLYYYNMPEGYKGKPERN